MQALAKRFMLIHSLMLMIIAWILGECPVDHEMSFVDKMKWRDFTLHCTKEPTLSQKEVTISQAQ